MSTPISIERPWLIVHEAPDGKMMTILAGPIDANHRQFGLVIADVARHVAQRYGVEVAEVMDWVGRELDHPTTDIQGGTVQ